MESKSEENSGITRIGIGDWLRTSCESTEGSSPSFRICEFCGKTYANGFSKRFCSNSCMHSYVSRFSIKNASKRNKEKLGVKCQCEFCGENFDAKIDLKKHLPKCEKANHKRGKSKKDGWLCKYCNEIFPVRRELNEHLKTNCDKKSKLAGKFGYDSLGRIKNYEAYKHAAETRRKKISSGELKVKGHLHTDESKKRISEARIAYLESHGNYGLKWYVVNGIKVQGTWEKRFAEYLVEKNIKFERKRLKFCKTHTYTPDFYCESQNVYFEVKGFRRDRDIYKMYLVLDEHPELHIKMIERSELENLNSIDIFSLPDFQEIYKRENIDMSTFKNVWT